MTIYKLYKKFFFPFLLFGLLVTFIVFIIQYMEGIKKNFWDINALIIAYSTILIIPFCDYVLKIVKGSEKITKYVYEILVFIFYIFNTSMYSSLNTLHPIKGNIVSSMFHVLFIIISILLFIIIFGMTFNSQSVKTFFDAFTKKIQNKYWLLIISIVLSLVNNIGVFFGVVNQKINHTVDT